MKTQALQYYMHDGPSAFRFELSGELTDDSARRLEQDWRTASSVMAGRMLIVDMTFITGADEAGRALLGRWHAAGAQLIASSKASRELAESVIGESLPECPAELRSSAARTWAPFRSFFEGAPSGARPFRPVMPAFRAAAVKETFRLPLKSILNAPSNLMFALALLLPLPVDGASLKTETVVAFDGYVQSTSVDLGGRFLRVYDDPKSLAKVRHGEIVVSPESRQNPKKVPGGLIHHWRGDAFVPDVKLDEMLFVVRDYDHYRDFYSPSVVESRAVARNGKEDQFSLTMMNKAFLVKTAFDADYHATNVRVDKHRFYSVSKTTRLQEVQAVGEPDQHKIAEGEGGGYVWKLFTISRLEERDGGVYIEVETVALSREIPAAMHLIVDPIVRRVSRTAMLTSLQQTAEAVRTLTAQAPPAPRRSGLPSNASAFVRIQ